MTEKKSWEDINIEGLSMESPEDSLEKSSPQRQARVSSKDLFVIALKETKTIEVQIHNLTDGKDFTGVVLDISPGGLKIKTPDELQKSAVLRISFAVGGHQFLCRAKVTWLKKEEEGCLAGLQFIAPKEADIDFIRSLHLAIHLK